ncbi:MAG: outer membrane protein assembly factor BamD [Vicinamibacteria bacterium]|nr:outer membrane protein assembly factor BamD [Vicinamibacteria bacterium]
MKRVVAALALLALAGCGHGGPVDIASLASNSAQVVWEAGQKAAEKKQWDAARQHFRRIIDGFPQSDLVPEARLALGESYFKEGGTANWILAAAAYKEFLTFYPSHPRADFAQFMVAESHFEQRNPPDRDQKATMEALEEFDRLLQLFPESAHVETTRERITTCRQSLARAEFVAGYFYQKTRQAWRAAIQRYEFLLKEYPDYAGLDEVLFRTAQCKSFQAQPAEALPLLARLFEEFPDSALTVDARALEAEVRAMPMPGVPAVLAPEDAPAAAPSPSPSPAASPQASLEP